MLHIGIMAAYQHPSLCRYYNIAQYFGEYAFILYGDSSKCIHIIMGTGLIHN
jgi:hypothetical protein